MDFLMVRFNSTYLVTIFMISNRQILDIRMFLKNIPLIISNLDKIRKLLFFKNVPQNSIKVPILRYDVKHGLAPFSTQ